MTSRAYPNSVFHAATTSSSPRLTFLIQQLFPHLLSPRATSPNLEPSTAKEKDASTVGVYNVCAACASNVALRVSLGAVSVPTATRNYPLGSEENYQNPPWYLRPPNSPLTPSFAQSHTVSHIKRLKPIPLPPLWPLSTARRNASMTLLLLHHSSPWPPTSTLPPLPSISSSMLQPLPRPLACLTHRHIKHPHLLSRPPFLILSLLQARVPCNLL